MEREILDHGSEDLRLLKSQFSLSWSIDSQQSQSQTDGLFVETDKLILKLTLKEKEPKTAKTTLKKKNKVEGLTLSDFKNYYKASVVKRIGIR